MSASRSAGAAPSLDDQISEVEEEIDVIEGAISRMVEKQVPPTESTKHRDMLHAILASLRELAALRESVADGDVTDLVLRLHRYHHAMHEEKGHRAGSELMVQAAALLERLARENDALRWHAGEGALAQCRDLLKINTEAVTTYRERIAALEAESEKLKYDAMRWRDYVSTRADPEPRE
jgi:hypothetical protein